MIVPLASLLGPFLERLPGWFQDHPFVAPFAVLMACGLGAPLPEEVTLIGCGLLLHHQIVNFLEITFVCSFAILLGDSIPYWLGRRYGLAALKTRWVAKVLHPERFAKLERKFAENGNWAIFTCRFLPGLRIPGYFTAGTLRMSDARFLSIDSLGVLVSVPTSIWVSKLAFDQFGDEISEVRRWVSQFNKGLLLTIALSLVVYFVVRHVRKKRADRAAAVPDASLAGPIPPAAAVVEPPAPAPIPATSERSPADA